MANPALFQCTLKQAFQHQLEFVRSLHISNQCWKSAKPDRVPVISCKISKLNHYHGQTYKKFQEIPLASKGWHNNKARDDHFTIYGNAGHTTYENELNLGKDFKGLGVEERIQTAVNNMGIVNPTEVQFRAIPKILEGNNTLITAETGCGKTLAYLVPILQQLLEWKPLMPKDRLNRPLSLVVAPSRELVEQIAGVVEKLYPQLNMTSTYIIGGHTKRLIMNPTFHDCDIVVSTLGALSKLVTTGIYKMDYVRHVVLDEADTLLDDSFNEKLSYFMRKLPFQYQKTNENVPTGCQLTMVSATVPRNITDLAYQFVHPDSIRKVTTTNLHKIMPHVPQKFVRLAKFQKPLELLKIVKADMNAKRPVIIFSNKSETCDFVSLFLNDNGVPCMNLTGSMHTDIKIGRFKKFNDGLVNVLSATDLVSRGLDTRRTQHVINYDFPAHTADYIHRCGRTGRVGGVENCLITNFVASYLEIKLVQDIELSVRQMEDIPKIDGNITKVIKRRIERELKKCEMQLADQQ